MAVVAPRNASSVSQVRQASANQELNGNFHVDVENGTPPTNQTLAELVTANQQLQRQIEQLQAQQNPQRQVRVANDWQARAGSTRPQESYAYPGDAMAPPAALDLDQSMSVLVNPMHTELQPPLNAQPIGSTARQNQLRGEDARIFQQPSASMTPSYHATGNEIYQDFQPPARQNLKDCDTYRRELLNTPITDIVLDIAPLRPDVAAQQIDRGIDRTWVDCSGNTLGSGKLIDLERSYIVIQTATGLLQRISMTLLSDGDLAIVTGYWALPAECSLGCYPFEQRCWNPNTVEWKAASLCHKPLYFENVQLERYGHSYGPIRQPIRSAAHFFVHLAMLPYQTGIHPANECMYALGYYRPGDCAPWLKEPFPISLRGAVRQAAYVGGAAILP